MTEPTDQHREQAREIAKRYTREGTGYADRLYQLAYAIEQALSSRDTEIREVLEGLRMRSPACWCDPYPVKEHGKPCLAARDLYAKLQPLPSENPSASLQK